MGGGASTICTGCGSAGRATTEAAGPAGARTTGAPLTMRTGASKPASGWGTRGVIAGAEVACPAIRAAATGASAGAASAAGSGPRCRPGAAGAACTAAAGMETTRTFATAATTGCDAALPNAGWGMVMRAGASLSGDWLGPCGAETTYSADAVRSSRPAPISTDTKRRTPNVMDRTGWFLGGAGRVCGASPCGKTVMSAP